MPGTEPPTLAAVLAELFAASARHGAGVHRRLTSGLHVKAALRGERRQLIVWRDGDRLPSAKECEIVGDDAGMIQPTFRSWQCQDSPSAFLITDAFRGELCDHAWGLAVHYDEQRASGETCCCGRCGATWRTSTPKRGRKLSRFYNGRPIRDAVFGRFLRQGPVPDGAGELVEAPALSQADPPSLPGTAAAVTGQVCGTCRFGTPDLTDVACTLGWVAHDGYWSERGKNLIPGAHPGVPLPLLAPQTKCLALGDRWLPRTAEVGAA